MNAEQLPYLKFCEGKAFLASKVSEEVKPLSTMKTKLEMGDKEGRGPLLGAGASQALKAKGFDDGKPLGPGQILINEDLGLHHAMLNELGGGWKEAYWAYGKQTKFGHLILAGNVENFAKWAASKACRDEVRGVDEGRLFAYIEHQQGDTNPGQGYIVFVDPSGKSGSATIIEGIGYIIFADGNTYHGELSRGLKHGTGSFTCASGDKYVGEWQHDKMYGQGSFTFANGDTYVGEYKNGIRHGQGSYTYSNGSSYVGQWENNVRHGQGSYNTYESGEKHEGQYKDGMACGEGCVTYPDGSSWKGPYVDDQMHGIGLYTFEDGTVEKVEYVRDVPKQ